MPARRQDNVTRGAEINFGEHEKFIYVNLRVWIMGRRLEKNFLFCEPCFLSLFRP